jgi:hypothetical protein
MKLAVANLSIKALESCVTWHGWEKNNPCIRPRSLCYVRVLRMIRAIIIEDDSNYTLTAIIIHICPYTPILRIILGTFHSLLRPNRPQSKGGALASLQLNLKRRSLQHLQAVSPIQPTKLTTDPGSTLFLRRNRKSTPTNHPATLPPYQLHHPTTSIVNPHYQQQPSLRFPTTQPAFGPATLRLLLCLRSPFL